MTGPSTNFYVGPQQKHYTIPKRLLYHFSDYAKACLEGQFSEAGANAVFLPDVDPNVFQYLWLWLYSGELTIPPHYICDWGKSRSENFTDNCRLFCQLHILGERLLFDHRFLGSIVQRRFDDFIKEENPSKGMALSPEIFEEVLTDSTPVIYEESVFWNIRSLRPFMLEHLCTFECCTTVDFTDYADCFEMDGGFAAEIVIYLASEIKWAKDQWKAQVGQPVDVFKDQELVTEDEGSSQCIATSSKLSKGVWVVLRRLCTSVDCSATEIRGFRNLFEMDGDFVAEFLNHMATELLLTVERWGEEKGEKVDFVAEKERREEEEEATKRLVQKIMLRGGWS